MKLSTLFLLDLIAITTAFSAPVTFSGGGTIALRPDPSNPNLTFDANTFSNDLIFIITDNSNAKMKITNIFDPVLTALDKNPTAMVDKPLEISDANGCKGMTLNPGQVCAFDVLFDTSGPDDGLSNKWQIGEQIPVQFSTQPFPTVGTVPTAAPLRVKVTVQDATKISTDPEASAVPEPATFLFAATVLPLIWFARRGYLRAHSLNVALCAIQCRESIACAAARPVRTQSGIPMPS